MRLNTLSWLIAITFSVVHFCLGNDTAVTIWVAASLIIAEIGRSER